MNPPYNGGTDILALVVIKKEGKEGYVQSVKGYPLSELPS